MRNLYFLNHLRVVASFSVSVSVNPLVLHCITLLHIISRVISNSARVKRLSQTKKQLLPWHVYYLVKHLLRKINVSENIKNILLPQEMLRALTNGEITRETMFPQRCFFVCGGFKNMTAFPFRRGVSAEINSAILICRKRTYGDSVIFSLSCNYLNPIKPSMAKFPYEKNK